MSLQKQFPFYGMGNFEFINEICSKNENIYFDNDLIRHLKQIANINDKEQNFNYYTEDEFNSKCLKIKNIEISAFHINIRSLNCNNRSLAMLLNCLNLKFDVLVLSEIWDYNLEFYKNLFQNYKFYYDCPTTSKVGGTGVYIKQDIACTDRIDLRISNVGVENLCLK